MPRAEQKARGKNEPTAGDNEVNEMFEDFARKLQCVGDGEVRDVKSNAPASLAKKEVKDRAIVEEARKVQNQGFQGEAMLNLKKPDDKKASISNSVSIVASPKRGPGFLQAAANADGQVASSAASAAMLPASASEQDTRPRELTEEWWEEPEDEASWRLSD